MGENITDRPIKRVLVLVELVDGAIGAAYSDHLEAGAVLAVQAEWVPTSTNGVTKPAYVFNVGPMATAVTHDPAFHDPAVESMAHAVMDQWKRGNG